MAIAPSCQLLSKVVDCAFILGAFLKYYHSTCSFFFEKFEACFASFLILVIIRHSSICINSVIFHWIFDLYVI